MTTQYEHRPHAPEAVSSKHPALLACSLLFFVAMLPLMLGLQPAQSVAVQMPPPSHSTTLVYEGSCHPFGSILDCIEVQSQMSQFVR